MPGSSAGQPANRPADPRPRALRRRDTEHRLAHDAATERETALREIERIGWYRLIDLVDNGPIGQDQRE